MTAPILVTGGGGMLATALGEVFGDNAELVSHADLDITDASAVQRAVAGRVAVINAAAFTAVDEAESNEAIAKEINAHGARNVALACADAGAIQSAKNKTNSPPTQKKKKKKRHLCPQLCCSSVCLP